MSTHKYNVGDRLLMGYGGRDGWERYEGREITVTYTGMMGEPYYGCDEVKGGVWEGWIVGLAPVGDPDDSEHDDVNHPKHYTSDPSGVECIQITRHRNFNIGNAFKYLWRNGLKDDAELSARQKQIQDLKKSVYYIEDEIKRLEAL